MYRCNAFLFSVVLAASAATTTAAASAAAVATKAGAASTPVTKAGVRAHPLKQNKAEPKSVVSAKVVMKTILLKNTFCIDMTDNKKEGSFALSIVGTSRMLSMDKSMKDYHAIHARLMDACTNKKALNVSFDDATQKILSAEFSLTK